MGCLVLLHLISVFQKDATDKGNYLRTSNRPIYLELETVEEDNFQIPPPKGKHSPHATRNPKKNRRTHPIVDEFLNKKSQIRHVFFPDKRTAIDPMNSAANDSFYYFPGRVWLDTEGNPIQAHGGGILYDERSGTYYWYGEYKDGPTYHAHKKGAARVSFIILNS